MPGLCGFSLYSFLCLPCCLSACYVTGLCRTWPFPGSLGDRAGGEWQPQMLLGLRLLGPPGL